MRFLIVSAAILACASGSGLLGPLVYGVNPGDAQAAAIDATVAVQDHARAAVDSHNSVAEQVVHRNTEALRANAETARDLNEQAYWSSYDAARTAESALSGQAAALDGLARSVPQPLVYGGLGALPYAAAPLGLGHLGLGPLGLGAAPLGLGLGHLGYGPGLLRGWH